MNDTLLKSGVTHLEQFFAVTLESVFVIRCDGDRVNGVKILTHVPRAGSEPHLITYGNMVSIGNRIRFMDATDGAGPVTDEATCIRPREVTDLNTWSHEDYNTLRVVALFLTDEEAVMCARSPNLVAFDPRWREKTIDVVKLIGHMHPYFAVSCETKYRLLSPHEWLGDDYAQKLPSLCH